MSHGGKGGLLGLGGPVVAVLMLVAPAAAAVPAGAVMPAGAAVPAAAVPAGAVVPAGAAVPVVRAVPAVPVGRARLLRPAGALVADTTTTTGAVTTSAPPTTVAPTTTTTSTVPPTTSSRPARTTTTTVAPTTATTAPPVTTSSSTPWGLIALIVVLVIAIVVIALLMRARNRRGAEAEWRRAVVPALSDAQLARESLLSGNGASEDPEVRGAVAVQVERAAAALDGAARKAPDAEAGSTTTSAARALRGLAFAVEADRLLRHGTAAPTGVQLAQADQARRDRGSELSTALARLSSRVSVRRQARTG